MRPRNESVLSRKGKQGYRRRKETHVLEKGSTFFIPQAGFAQKHLETRIFRGQQARFTWVGPLIPTSRVHA